MLTNNKIKKLLESINLNLKNEESAANQSFIDQQGEATKKNNVEYDEKKEGFQSDPRYHELIK